MHKTKKQNKTKQNKKSNDSSKYVCKLRLAQFV